MTVIGPHRLALTFSSANRYTLKEGDGFTTMLLKDAFYRLPLPDFAVRAGVRRAFLLSDQSEDARFNGRPAQASTCDDALGSQAPPNACRGRYIYTAPDTERELVVQLARTRTAPALLTVVVETRAALPEQTGWSTDDPSRTVALPAIHPVMDYILRDTSIRPGKDGEFFMTGSTGAPDMWAVTSDIQLWRSTDLRSWTPVVQKPRPRSVVWSIDREGTWQRTIALRDGAPFRPLWAPEIHYLKGTYWIPYSIPRLGTGLLKSVNGKPEGPYVSALKVDAPLTNGIDASLFQDEDGRVYFLWAGGLIARMTDAMDALAEEPRQLRPANAPLVGFEGSSLFKYRGRYYLSAADFTNGDYNCFTASSDTLYGPYGDRYISVPHGGHNNFFQDKTGRWWSTFFGNDEHAPFRERPSVVPMHFDPRGELKPDASYNAEP